MKFDVIIGNPPYQLNDGGGTGSSAKPIYHYFVEQAKKLNPRFLIMIIPSRWFSGGKGLDTFRDAMLNDDRVRHLVDYTDSTEVFPGVDIAGGVCYFLWDRDNRGLCRIENIHHSTPNISERPLNEFGTFVRDSLSVSIIKKVKDATAGFLDQVVSSRKPFGLDSKVRPLRSGDITVISSAGRGPYQASLVPAGKELIDRWKVLLSKASVDHAGQADKEGKRRVFSVVEAIPPGTVCTESYLLVGTYDTQEHADNMVTYLRTKFCRFLVGTILFTQNISKDRFAFVPDLDMSQRWTDDRLYAEYKLTQQEIAFIDSRIRPMESNGE